MYSDIIFVNSRTIRPERTMDSQQFFKTYSQVRNSGVYYKLFNFLLSTTSILQLKVVCGLNVNSKIISGLISCNDMHKLCC